MSFQHEVARFNQCRDDFKFNIHLCHFILLLGVIFINDLCRAQQLADSTYNPVIHDPAYALGSGPVVFIDEGHNNFHTREGRYRAFAELLSRDGYRVQSYVGTFRDADLKEGKILVISNALNALNTEDWYLPTPSAFSPEEIALLDQWVREGGRLFLIADHMPMAGAASDLASVFGFGFTNGFVIDTAQWGPLIFRQSDQNLLGNAITSGRREMESVGEVASFTGQAFSIPDSAIPILLLPKGLVNFIPDTAWVFDDSTLRLDPAGMYQGAYVKHGAGRVVVFGEAGMFTAQLAGPQQYRMGMNNEVAEENYQLLLNIIHWLDGLIP